MRGVFLNFTIDLPTICVVDSARPRLCVLLPFGQGSFRHSLKRR